MNDKGQKWTVADHEAAMRIGRVFAKKPWPGFDAAVQEYRQIEAELVEQAGDDEFIVLETRRRIAEWIVTCADHDDVPFEQFQEAWNGLLALGFTDLEMKVDMVCCHADYCLSNEHYDIGLGVIEPVIVEYEEWLQTAVLRPKARKFRQDNLEHLKFRRDGLVALRSGGEEAAAWLERLEAREPSSQDSRKHDLNMKLFDAMKAISASSSDRSHADIERAYRQVEADFLARLVPDDEPFVPELKQRITIAIFRNAHAHRQSFEVCRDLWNELRPWDFGHLENKCPMIRRYAECCSFNGQPDAGLAVVEPFLAELQQHVDAGTDEDMPSEKYPEEIALLTQLRDELNALKK